MRVDTGDLWTYPADVRVITTNGVIKANGELIMGKGTALQAKERYPGIALELGQLVEANGNNPSSYTAPDGTRIWTFPVKWHWSMKADFDLMAHSCHRLMRLANLLQEVRAQQGRETEVVIVMPRPGCGEGGREWTAVKAHIENLLDDRFVVLIPPASVVKPTPSDQ
jgi:hypothetical protein